MRVILITFFVFIVYVGNSQYVQNTIPSSTSIPVSVNFKERIKFGGNFGVSAGNPTNIMVSPTVGYILPNPKLKDKLMLGMGLNYTFSRYFSSVSTPNTNRHIFGLREFIRFSFTPQIFGYIENETLNSPSLTSNDSKRVFVNSIFFGGGYIQKVGLVNVSFTLLYNLTWRANNPVYRSPFDFRVGFVL